MPYPPHAQSHPCERHWNSKEHRPGELPPNRCLFEFIVYTYFTWILLIIGHQHPLWRSKDYLSCWGFHVNRFSFLPNSTKTQDHPWILGKWEIIVCKESVISVWFLRSHWHCRSDRSDLHRRSSSSTNHLLAGRRSIWRNNMKYLQALPLKTKAPILRMFSALTNEW